MPTIEVRIANGTDDVEERSSGTMSMTSSDLELAVDGSTVQTVGLRFLGIDIPQGAVITRSYIQFQTDEVKTGAASLVIRGEDTGDAAAFASTAYNASSRLKTDAAVGWSPTAWSVAGEASLAQRTPDITTIVQEIVGRSDWAALSDMAFLITGTGTRTAEAYESGAAAAPLLHIEYTLSSPVVGNLSISDVSVSEGQSGTTLATFTVSRTGGTAAFSVNYATANGSAAAGSDYAAIPLTTLNFAQGETAKTLSVTITGDTAIESNETFFVNLSNAVGPGASIVDGTGVGTIVNDDFASTQIVVRNVWSTAGLASPWGSPDPSGLAYVQGKGLFLCDSEVNESPFNSSNNMFLVQPNNGGPLTLAHAPYQLTGFTIEPTGLAYAPSTDLLYISDDDADRIYWVDPDNPQVKLGEFRTGSSTDAEDVAYDRFDGDVSGGDGHLYIANGAYHNIKEFTTTGTLVRTIPLPSVIKDPEALLWDDAHNIFFVGGKFSSNIWIVNRNGVILDTITQLDDYDRPGGAGVKVTDFELAPTSDPNDDPALFSLYVADYGADQINDGRLFEIDLRDYFFG